MIPSHHSRSSKDSHRLVSTPLRIMNRGRLPFYGSLRKTSGDTNTNSPPRRRLSASAALQVLRDHSGLFAEEEKHDMLPIVKVAARKRFSLRSSNNSINKDISPIRKKSNFDSSSSNSGTATTMSASRSHQTDTTLPPSVTVQAQGRRRSSRKSVNGLVIEFDVEDESECTMFEQCEDYQDDWRPGLKREDSSESLEELRTRLEAFEHELQSQQLLEHDEIGLRQECIQKNYMEALESSATMCSSSVGTSIRSLRGIPEHKEIVNANGRLEEEDSEEDDEASRGSSRVQRRSTIRSSILGLVLEYDWSSGSESEEEGEEQEEAAEDD